MRINPIEIGLIYVQTLEKSAATEWVKLDTQYHRETDKLRVQQHWQGEWKTVVKQLSSPQEWLSVVQWTACQDCASLVRKPYDQVHAVRNLLQKSCHLAFFRNQLSPSLRGGQNRCPNRLLPAESPQPLSYNPVKNNPKCPYSGHSDDCQVCNKA